MGRIRKLRKAEGKKGKSRRERRDGKKVMGRVLGECRPGMKGKRGWE